MNFKNFKRLPYSPAIQGKHLVYGIGFKNYEESLSFIKERKQHLLKHPELDKFYEWMEAFIDAKDFLEKCRDNIF